jgi:hypothetical protein
MRCEGAGSYPGYTGPDGSLLGEGPLTRCRPFDHGSATHQTVSTAHSGEDRGLDGHNGGRGRLFAGCGIEARIAFLSVELGADHAGPGEETDVRLAAVCCRMLHSIARPLSKRREIIGLE